MAGRRACTPYLVNTLLLDKKDGHMSFGMGAGIGKKQNQKPLQWIQYAEGMKMLSEELEGKFKPFNQKQLQAAWANLTVMSDVRGGVCRALSAVYLCRQYVMSRVKDADGELDGKALNDLAMRDPPLGMTGKNRFFGTFREGRLDDDEYQGLKKGIKVQREPRPEYESRLNPIGSGLRGKLAIQKDGRWKELTVNGRPAKELGEPWRVRRIEHMAEVHHDTRFSGAFTENVPVHLRGKTLANYQGEMANAMEHFSAEAMLTENRHGVINLAGPYEDWIWDMRGASQGYFMCWVTDHVCALAVHMFGWNGYTVKFFDPNYGECKFKKMSHFKEFCNRISEGFCRQYHQKKMDYTMFG